MGHAGHAKNYEIERMAFAMVATRLGTSNIQELKVAPLILEEPRNGKPTIWVTSDTHFGHANIITYCNRPYEDVAEMDEKLIEGWNSLVDEDDIVYHLGDFCFGDEDIAGEYLRKLNGYIILCSNPWHHDKWLQRKSSPVRGIYVLETLIKIKFEGPMIVMNYKDMPVHMTHYPLWSWEKKFHGGVHIHGHIHGRTWMSPVGGLSVDAGVDACNYAPIQLEFIYQDWLRRRDNFNGSWEWPRV